MGWFFFFKLKLRRSETKITKTRQTGKPRGGGLRRMRDKSTRKSYSAVAHRRTNHTLPFSRPATCLLEWTTVTPPTTLLFHVNNNVKNSPLYHYPTKQTSIYTPNIHTNTNNWYQIRATTMAQALLSTLYSPSFNHRLLSRNLNLNLRNCSFSHSIQRASPITAAAANVAVSPKAVTPIHSSTQVRNLLIFFIFYFWLETFRSRNYLIIGVMLIYHLREQNSLLARAWLLCIQFAVFFIYFRNNYKISPYFHSVCYFKKFIWEILKMKTRKCCF